MAQPRKLTDEEIKSVVDLIKEYYSLAKVKKNSTNTSNIHTPTKKNLTDILDRHKFGGQHFQYLFNAESEELNENIKLALEILGHAPSVIKGEFIKIFASNAKVSEELRLQIIRDYQNTQYLKQSEAEILLEKIKSQKTAAQPKENPWDHLKQTEATLANPVYRKEANLGKLHENYEKELTHCSQELFKHALNVTLNKGPETSDNVQHALDEFEQFIRDDILTTANPDERVLRVERYIQLWSKAHNSGNFYSCCAIFNALHHPNITPLIKTFADISDSAKNIKNKLDAEMEKAFPGQSHLTAANVLTLSSVNRSSPILPAAPQVVDPIKEHQPLSPKMSQEMSASLVKAENNSTSRIMDELGSSFTINPKENVNPLPHKDVIDSRKQHTERMSELLDSMLIIVQQMNDALRQLTVKVETLIASEAQQTTTKISKP